MNSIAPAVVRQAGQGVTRAATEAIAVEPRGRSDVATTEFKVLMEVKGSAPQLARRLKGTGFSADACPRDCSHGDGWGDQGYSSYARIGSSATSIASGGLDRLTEALATLKNAGVSPGPTGCMRIYVKRSELDEAATARLMNLFRSHEAVLYRIAQNGSAVRTLQHRLHYSRPLSALADCQSGKGWTSALSSHVYAINASQRDWWEFRFFDASLDDKAVRASVQMVLGLVAAARDGRGESGAPEGVTVHYNEPVNRRRWNQLVHTIGASPQLKRQLQEQFRAAGGVLEAEVMPAEQLALAERLMAHQYRFATAAGEPLASVDDLNEHVSLASPLQLVTPDGTRTT